MMLIISVFILSYIMNMFFITVLYHRGLAHGSVKLTPKMKKFVASTGVWVTGIEPKAWALMHRVHHRYSDQSKDPHSPMNGGILSVWKSQYVSYLYFRERMRLKDNKEYNELMQDLDFPVSHVGTNLPYLLHILIAIAVAYFFKNYSIGLAYFSGAMGHPLQGWMINALAHKFGRRNYDTNDHSKNNLLLSYFVFGEGLQNNHHAHPERANFAVKFPEFDPGYLLCKLGSFLRIVKI